MKNHAYEIGYEHGASGFGTNGYKPGARRGGTLERYQAGFQHGMRNRHDSDLEKRQAAALLNVPHMGRAEYLAAMAAANERQRKAEACE